MHYNMDKLTMQTANGTKANVEKIAALFPNCVTETIGADGKPQFAVDFDQLRQELSSSIVEGHDERYQFTWPDKKKAILAANAPISATLRPCREESVDFDNTKNLYIEGDNLDVLKCLKETYSGKVKMIYIDPPYNTGNDFVYEDDFAQSADEYLANSGQFDDQGNRLVTNTESNGRFHTDWLNMMYPRLKVARDLLSEDGVIFISLDDNEIENLKKMCAEIFGESNFIAQLATVMNLKGNNDQFGFAGTHEYTLVYAKNLSALPELNGIALTDEDIKEYKEQDHIGKYKIGATLMRTGEAGAREKRPKGYYPIYVSKDLKSLDTIRHDESDIVVYPKTKDGIEMSWRRSPEFLHQTREEFIIRSSSSGITFYKKQRLEDDLKSGKKPKSLFYKPEYSSGNGTSILKEMFNGRIFDNPKPLALMEDFVRIGSSDDSIILDFFSGSATTAHAVMLLNAKVKGNRSFIMVQLPEVADSKSETYKAGYKNICEVGKERIRRSGKRVLAETGLIEGSIDTGFRVLKLDSSNMLDVFYEPQEVKQQDLFGMADNIKSDRTAEDLLFQVMLELGVMLDSKIVESTIAGKKMFNVADGFLLACFDKDVNDAVITDMAKQQPAYAVLRDSSYADDSTATNFEQIFKTYSPNTIIKAL